MLRAIREISPRWIVGENVRGIVNWSNGMVFEQVCSDLEAEGYEVTPFLLPACGVDAPHERYRMWFVAHRTDAGTQGLQQRQDGVCEFGAIADTDNSRGRTSENEAIRNGASNSEQRQHSLDRTSRLSKIGSTPNADGQRQHQQPRNGISNGTNQFSGIFQKTGFDAFPTQSPVCSRNDGFSARLDGITFPRWRSESIKGFGNTVVPQVVLQIFNVINYINQQ